MMKTNAKRKNSAVKKLIPAAGMLALSASMLATSTYAWFTMNKTVSVTGMQVHTTVGSNLLISETNASAASYGNSLTQARECLLEPSSSVDGIAYYWTSTSNVDARGDAKTESYTAYNENTAWDSAHTAAGKAGYDAAFNTNYGKTNPTANYTDVAYGYIDYTFYLKAVNTEATTQQVDLTKLELKYNNATVTDRAWRAALIVQDITSQTEYTAFNTAPVATNVVSLFTLDGAANFDNAPKAIGAVSDGEGGTKGGLTALAYGDSVTDYNQDGTFVQTINSGATAYYKVTVRLWLEGEDTSCTNATYARLTQDYTLDLEFSIDPTATAVDEISTPANS